MSTRFLTTVALATVAFLGAQHATADILIDFETDSGYPDASSGNQNLDGVQGWVAAGGSETGSIAVTADNPLAGAQSMLVTDKRAHRSIANDIFQHDGATISYLLNVGSSHTYNYFYVDPPEGSSRTAMLVVGSAGTKTWWLNNSSNTEVGTFTHGDTYHIEFTPDFENQTYTFSATNLDNPEELVSSGTASFLNPVTAEEFSQYGWARLQANGSMKVDNLTVIPEPSTMGAVGLFSLALLMRRR